jgi:nucleoside-diphosphate-sugar epimerase
MTAVFITGATGFIGRAVLRETLRCLGAEDRVYLLVRRGFDSADERVVTVVGDLESLEMVADIVRKVDFIMHIAGDARLCGEHDYGAVNVAATQRLVDLAREGNTLRRFIFVSSIAAMDRAASDRCSEPLTIASPCVPRTGYGRSKRTAEEIVLRSNLPYTIFRPGFVYGPGMREDSHLRKFARLIHKGFPLQLLGFPGKISLIHVNDLAVAMASCVKSELGVNRTYLAETEFMPLGDVLSLIAESLNGMRPLQVQVPAMKSVLQRMHSRLPVIVAGMLLDYFWMNDPTFRDEFIDDSQQRSLRDNVSDITSDLLGKSG